MKEPSLKNIRIDKIGTKRVRALMSQSKKIKITINVDSDSLDELRAIAKKTGVPYQRLLNKILADGLTREKPLIDRIEQLEREVATLKKRRAA